jgi:hypothetical protein
MCLTSIHIFVFELLTLFFTSVGVYFIRFTSVGEDFPRCLCFHFCAIIIISFWKKSCN